MLKRTQTELKKLNQNPIQGITVQETQDPSKWNVIIDGPIGSYYEGGRFSLEVIFPDNYPFKMAQFKFKTRIWHPNIGDSDKDMGEVCRQMLGDDQWVPTKMTQSVFELILSMLSEPQTEHPINNDANNQYVKDRDAFKDTVQKYISTYAKQ